MSVEFVEGILKIANVVLSLVAGYIGISLIRSGKKRKDLRAWKILIAALIFFFIQEILGALRAFGLYSSPYLTHVMTSFMLTLLIFSLAMQIFIGLTDK